MTSPPRAVANDSEPVFDGQGGCPVYHHDDNGDEWITHVPQRGHELRLTCKDGTWVARPKAGSTGTRQGAFATAVQVGAATR